LFLCLFLYKYLNMIFPSYVASLMKVNKNLLINLNDEQVEV